MRAHWSQINIKQTTGLLNGCAYSTIWQLWHAHRNCCLHDDCCICIFQSNTTYSLVCTMILNRNALPSSETQWTNKQKYTSGSCVGSRKTELPSKILTNYLLYFCSHRWENHSTVKVYPPLQCMSFSMFDIYECWYHFAGRRISAVLTAAHIPTPVGCGMKEEQSQWMVIDHILLRTHTHTRTKTPTQAHHATSERNQNSAVEPTGVCIIILWPFLLL